MIGNAETDMTKSRHRASSESLAKARMGTAAVARCNTMLRLAVGLVLAGEGLLPGGTAPYAGPSPSSPVSRAKQGPTAERPPLKSPWERIVMVGASASAGFTESEPLGGSTTPRYRLSRYLDAALAVPHEPVRNLANALFYWDPESTGRYQVEQALQSRPTLVVGVDFLFWFCYGEGRTDQERLKRFEKGLKLLEAVSCPLILGDIPDASVATNSMLRLEDVPSGQAMAAANRRLKEWAAARRHVVVVSLSGFMRAVLGDRAVSVHGRILPAGKTRALVQPDQLHPTPAGAAVLALLILDALQSTQSAAPAGGIRWDPDEVYRLGIKNAPADGGAVPSAKP